MTRPVRQDQQLWGRVTRRWGRGIVFQPLLSIHARTHQIQRPGPVRCATKQTSRPDRLFRGSFARPRSPARSCSGHLHDDDCPGRHKVRWNPRGTGGGRCNNVCMTSWCRARCDFLFCLVYRVIRDLGCSLAKRLEARRRYHGK